MKASKIIKPIVIGAVTTAAIGVAVPQYTTIAAASSGIYILYSIITAKDETAKAMGITIDRERNKIIAVIRNPSKKPITIKSQVRLKDIIPDQPGMMKAGTDRDATTLIGESGPITISPSSTVRVEYDLLIPKEMLDSSNGIIQIKIEPSIELPKEAGSDAIKKIDASLEKIENIVKLSQSTAKIETPKPIAEQPAIQDNIIETIEPEQKIEIIDSIPEENIPNDDISTFIENSLNEVNVKYETLEEDFIPAPRPIEYDRGKGRSIGISITMLDIIRKIDQIKTINAKYLENKDAI